MMKKMRLQNVVFVGCILILIHGVSRSASLSYGDPLLGVAPEDENYYLGLSSRGTIKCKDGSKKFNKSQLNDDFCDCPDGSDEPGTAACPNGKFFCKNTGHASLFLYSSRVNDGICDCCDGSDEYNSITKCSNTCWEAGKVAREKLKKKIATYQEGVTIRKQEIELVKSAIAKEEAELSKLKNEEKILNGLVQQLKEHKEQIEKEEEKERLQKEKEEKERKEAEDAKEKEFTVGEKGQDIESGQDDIHDKIGLLDQPPQDSAEDHHVSISEPEHSDNMVKEGLSSNEVEEVKDDPLQVTKRHVESSTTDGKAGLDSDTEEKNVAENTDLLSREELGRRVASRWTGEKTEQPVEEFDTFLNKDQEHPGETPNETNDEEYNGYDSEEDVHGYDDDDSEDQVDDFEGEDHDDSSSSHKIESDDESDISASTSSQSWLEKVQQTVKSIFQAVNLFQAPIDRSDAARIRKEYEESSAKLSKIQSRISSLTQKLKQDFGQEKEFYSFYGQCFEIKQNKLEIP